MWRDPFLYHVIEGHCFVTLSRSQFKWQMGFETSSDGTKLYSTKGELFLFVTNLKLCSSLPVLIDCNSYPRICSFYYIVEMFLHSQGPKFFSFINAFKCVLSTYCALGARNKILMNHNPCTQGSWGSEAYNFLNVREERSLFPLFPFHSSASPVVL